MIALLGHWPAFNRISTPSLRTGTAFRTMDFEMDAIENNPAKALNRRRSHYDRLHHMKRVRELMALPELDSSQVGMLRDSRAILNGESLQGGAVDLADVAYLAELDAFEALENERRSKPYWVPDWRRESRIDTASNVADAMDRYYKHDRLNRAGGTRERLIADREQELAEKGFACIASFHDSVNGQGVYLRGLSDGLSIWSTHRR